MKRSRVIWGVVSLAVLITIAITMGTKDSHSQQKPKSTPTPDNRLIEEQARFPIVDYDSPANGSSLEQENRKLVNKKYDGEYLVPAAPYPEDEGSVVHDELPKSPLFPVAESDLIILGSVIDSTAFLSNDKRNVYTEFRVRAVEILKDDSESLKGGAMIGTDRQGGIVRYADGKKLIVKNARRKLLGKGESYVLFLTKDKETPNFRIITAFEVSKNDFRELNSGNKPVEFKELDVAGFIAKIRGEVAREMK